MPLLSGKENMGNNIEELQEAGYKKSQAIAIAYKKASEDDLPLTEFELNKKTARELDVNGWAEIKGNPISKVGVFPYSGAQINSDLDPNKIYMVYRPESELNNPETINSFKLLPWTDEHTMLGAEGNGLTPAERKGIHGVIGEDVYFEDGYLKGNLKIFSDELASLIDSGKKELSIGYRCLYDMSSGVYNGEEYDFIQREIRGNHLALVEEGRSGHDVSVLDHLKFTFDSGALTMTDYEKSDFEKKEGDLGKPQDSAKDEGEMSIEECRSMLKKLSNQLERMSETKDEREDDDKKDAKDVQPEDFVSKAEVTDADEDKDDDKKDDKKDDKRDGMDSMRNVLKEISRRDDLAESLSKHVGVFDHKEKTVSEVAQYGVKKLGLKCIQGHEESVLSGYLAGARLSTIAVAQDSKPSSDLVDAYLKGSN